MRMSPRRSYLGVVMIFCLMAITLYLAFAFPYTLFHLKQTETTEIKSVIMVGRGGERSPSPESYFIGEEPPEELHKFGYDQLTNSGKERMFLLGKFLKLRYYHLLLNGDPRKIYARSSDSDRCLESAQSLLAGLNPPKDQWIWSTATSELIDWQPKAIHTKSANTDDLLAVEPSCPLLELDKTKWKSSAKYQQLLNEFRHDLQTLRADTGLEFEDDLEMLSNIEDALKTRKAYKDNYVPAWYTSNFASRLAHIADVTTESRFSSVSVQRIYVGRLLHEIADKVNKKILLHKQGLVGADGSSNVVDEFLKAQQQKQQAQSQQQSQQPQQQTDRSSMKPQNEPNVFVYITSKQRLAALMNSLQIYSSQPHFGTLLLIELHWDPINQVHFLRLFTVSSSNPNVFPEPLRVNPLACVDSPECAPQQFEQNIRHLMLDEASWDEVCIGPDNQSAPTATPAFKPLTPLINDEQAIRPLVKPEQQQQQQQVVTQPPSSQNLTSDNSDNTTTTTTVPSGASEANGVPASTSASEYLDKLDENLIVGPKNVLPSGVAGDEHNKGNHNHQQSQQQTVLPNNSNLSTYKTNIGGQSEDGLSPKATVAEGSPQEPPGQPLQKQAQQLPQGRTQQQQSVQSNDQQKEHAGKAQPEAGNSTSIGTEIVAYGAIVPARSSGGTSTEESSTDELTEALTVPPLPEAVDKLSSSMLADNRIDSQQDAGISIDKMRGKFIDGANKQRS